ncbi:cytochrome c [Luteolibacter sp. SL250]|uniref:c-type cytochrome n=1 Tax=Luteolibacter sp. SL250 TaxID=2995170 RepID=UPI00226F1128|nr:cytochrome c [Luteolibacter sp. SL250]WAC20597.1 cytochrome c [Luteolibacter sp. SL250]
MPKALPALLLASALSSIPASGNEGFSKYTLCAACHGQSGEGTNLGPPLAGSEWVNGPARNLILIQLLGLQGPIKVKGVDYHFPGGMPALGHQSDEDIATVLTFVRSSFGNDAPAITAAEVAEVRKDAGNGPLTVADLITPSPTAQAKRESTGRYDDLEASSGPPAWLWIAIVAAAAGGGIFALSRRS